MSLRRYGLRFTNPQGPVMVSYRDELRAQRASLFLRSEMFGHDNPRAKVLVAVMNRHLKSWAPDGNPRAGPPPYVSTRHLDRFDDGVLGEPQSVISFSLKRLYHRGFLTRIAVTEPRATITPKGWAWLSAMGYLPLDKWTSVVQDMEHRLSTIDMDHLRSEVVESMSEQGIIPRIPNVKVSFGTLADISGVNLGLTSDLKGVSKIAVALEMEELQAYAAKEGLDPNTTLGDIMDHRHRKELNDQMTAELNEDQQSEVVPVPPEHEDAGYQFDGNAMQVQRTIYWNNRRVVVRGIVESDHDTVDVAAFQDFMDDMIRMQIPRYEKYKVGDMEVIRGDAPWLSFHKTIVLVFLCALASGIVSAGTTMIALTRFH